MESKRRVLLSTKAGFQKTGDMRYLGETSIHLSSSTNMDCHSYRSLLTAKTTPW